MKKASLILMTMLCLTGCIRFFPGFSRNIPDRPQVAIAPILDVIWRYATVLKYDKHLHLKDSKVYYDDYVRRVRIDLITQEIIELCDARALIVDLVDEFLKRLNENGPAKDQILSGHFDVTNLEIYIHFESYFCLYVDPAMIGWISLKDGITTFYAGDVLIYRFDQWHARSEPFSTSQQIVHTAREAEDHYKQTHPPPVEDKFYFDKGKHAPIDWFSK